MPEPTTRPQRRAGASSGPIAGLLLALVLALPVALVGLVGAAVPAAAACSCQRTDTEAQARGATDVFVGVVTDRTVQRGSGVPIKVFTHKVDVELVHKGGLRDQVVSVTTQANPRGVPGDCGLGRLQVGGRHVFMVRETDGLLVASGCSGTREAKPRLLAVLGELYPNAAPPRPEVPPVEAAFERVSDVGDPPPLTRLVAPGAALVLAGLLGLVVVRTLARRS